MANKFMDGLTRLFARIGNGARRVAKSVGDWNQNRKQKKADRESDPAYIAKRAAAKAGRKARLEQMRKRAQQWRSKLKERMRKKPVPEENQDPEKAPKPTLKPKHIVQMVLVFGTWAVLTVLAPWWGQLISGIIFGVLIAVIFLLLLVPFFKDDFTHHPAHTPEEDKFKFLIEVQQGRETVITQGGRPLYIIEGGNFKPEEGEAFHWLWWLYQSYIYDITGLHVYIPYFTKPHVYDLPRYDAREKDGKLEFHVVPQESPRYRSNHVRVETTTWYFIYTGVDVQRIPFTVTGAVHFRIIPGMAIRALFDIESWNVALTMALNSTVREHLRENLTLDQLLGTIPRDIWEKQMPKGKDIDKERLGKDLEEALEKYEFKRVTYEDPRNLVEGQSPKEEKTQSVKLNYFGIDIQRVDIVDLEDELEGAQREQFYAAAIGREKARARALEGKGQAEAEEALRAVHDKGGEMSKEIIRGRALVDAAKGSDILGALAAGVARKQIGSS